MTHLSMLELPHMVPSSRGFIAWYSIWENDANDGCTFLLCYLLCLPLSEELAYMIKQATRQSGPNFRIPEHTSQLRIG